MRKAPRGRKARLASLDLKDPKDPPALTVLMVRRGHKDRPVTPDLRGHRDRLARTVPMAHKDRLGHPVILALTGLRVRLETPVPKVPRGLPARTAPVSRSRGPTPTPPLRAFRRLRRETCGFRRTPVAVGSPETASSTTARHG